MTLSKRAVASGIATLVASVTTLITPLAASSAEATTRTQATAEASFSQADAAGCIVTETNLLAVDEASRSGPTAATSSWIYLSMGRYDNCAGQSLFVVSHSQPLPADAFDVAEGSRTAQLNTSVDVVELVTGTPLTIDLRLSWVGGEVVQRDHGHANDWTELGMSAYVYGDNFRTAIASGAVTAGTSDFTTGAAARAFIGAIREGSTQVVAQSSPFAARTELLSLAASTVAQGFDQEGVAASYRTMDASGCVETALFIAAYDRRFLVTGHQPIRARELIVSLVRYDLCRNAYLSSVYVEAPLTEEQFAIDGLRDSRLQAVVPAVDYFLGPLTLEIDLEFEGSGPTYRYVTTETSRTTDGFNAGHGSGEQRNATVTGVVSDGTPSITGPYDAFIHAARSRYVGNA